MLIITETHLKQIYETQKIHMVYPQNPCCLRTCINDFTYTKENSDDPIRSCENRTV